MPDRRTMIKAVAAAGFFPWAALAAEPGRTDAAMVTDWPWLGRYAGENARINAANEKVDIVFIGDSITELWGHRRPDFFAEGRVNRGIGGQTSPQILLRMMADVVAHRPKIVHILAGTNDVAENTGVIAPEATVNNLIAMVQLARANGIRPVVGTIPPAARFFWRPEVRPIEKISEINRELHRAAQRHRIILVDYHSALASADGALAPEFGADGVHPNALGYKKMEQLLGSKVRAFRVWANG